jgi:hypothetical protein
MTGFLNAVLILSTCFSIWPFFFKVICRNCGWMSIDILKSRLLDASLYVLMFLSKMEPWIISILVCLKLKLNLNSGMHAKFGLNFIIGKSILSKLILNYNCVNKLTWNVFSCVNLWTPNHLHLSLNKCIITYFICYCYIMHDKPDF